MVQKGVLRSGLILVILLVAYVKLACAGDDFRGLSSVCELKSVKDLILGDGFDGFCLVSGNEYGFGVIEGDETSLQKAINGIGTNTHDYVVVLFYASWCPFSTILRPSLSTMSSLYPSIPHFAIEESVVKPRALIQSLKEKQRNCRLKKMTLEKDDRSTAEGIAINNGMNDTTVIPLPGASHHMTEGDVCFDNGFVLRNVLYVHGLTCNLLSVPQLLDEENCIVQFAPNICVIQDLTSRTVIGAGERRDGGLFYFREMPPTRAFKTTTTLPFDLWHKRLGHPSLEVLKLLPQVNLNKKDKELSQSCDVCHRAKQSREKFPVSDKIIVWVYLLAHKSEVFESMKLFLAMVKRQFNKLGKIVRSDNGTEFTCMKQFFLDERIIFQTSCVGTPQQNGRVERKHRHILNVARALRFQSSLPIDFWGECILTAAYLINRTPSPILKGKTPYTVLHNVEPPYNHLQPIVPSVNDNEYNDTGLHEEPPSQEKRGNELVNEETTVHDNQTMRDDDTLSSPQSLNVEEQIQEENLGRGHRKKETSVRLRDYVTNTVKKKSPSRSTPPAQSRSSGTPYPIAHYVNCDRFSSCHRTFLEAIEKEREPVTYYEAIKDKRWRSAMDSELEALEQNKTWTIEKLPPNKKALGCKWVYKIKYKSDGTIERFKARLVILGNHQVAGVDYSETFAPVAKMVTVRVFLAIAAAKQWELHQMDVHNAFLHGDLEEEVFMKLPPGLHKGQPGEACKLRNLKYFLGIEVTRAKEGIFLCQRKYALDIISEVGLLEAKPAKIPMEQNHHLGLAQGRLFEDPGQYRRRSLTGWLVYLGDSPISWKTKKQNIVSRSSAEAEYRSMALTADELKWLKGLLKSFGIHHSQPMLLYCDSQVALHISRNPVFHERTKHIEVDCHYIRDELVSGNLDARHVHTKEQVADFFTKALEKTQFDYLLRKLGVQDLHLPT
ncbi:retrovirus-related pol polyprotein from transposon TNT 1-94 [Tanacetum coccineum]